MIRLLEWRIGCLSRSLDRLLVKTSVKAAALVVLKAWLRLAALLGCKDPTAAACI